MPSLVTTTIVGGFLAAGAAYYLGFLDTPPFVLRENLLKVPKEIVVIIATLESSDYGGNIGRLLQDTKTALVQAKQSGPMAQAAMMYLESNDGDLSLFERSNGSKLRLAVGLYADNPKHTVNPRWGVGWAVNLPYDQALALTASLDYPGTETLRTVRLGPNPVLQAHIPYRTMLTPMIAPLLHWPRVSAMYESDDVGTFPRTFHGRENGNDNNSNAFMACEVYVSGPTDAIEQMDYNLILGDTTRIWDDAFPLPNSKTSGANGEDEADEGGQSSRVEDEGASDEL